MSSGPPLKLLHATLFDIQPKMPSGFFTVLSVIQFITEPDRDVITDAAEHRIADVRLLPVTAHDQNQSGCTAADSQYPACIFKFCNNGNDTLICIAALYSAYR